MLKLKYYLTKFNNLVAQGSEEWLNGRTSSFGGSEMGTLLGDNQYESWVDLKKKKRNKQCDHNDITEWGHLFEPVSKLYIIKEYGDIYDFGSIPHTFYPICYSPDGLLVVDKKLVLLEIKNPIMRGTHKIPQIYIDQVLTGLSIIPAEYCLFVQFRFRRCKYKSNRGKPWKATYDRLYHKEFMKRQPDAKPISYGFLYWKTENKDLLDLALYDKMYPKYMDLGKPQVFIETDLPYTSGTVLMWKLFEMVPSSVKPNTDFLKQNEDLLWQKYKDLLDFKD